MEQGGESEIKEESQKLFPVLLMGFLFCREEEGIESRGGDRYRRQQRRGYPPVTPNACAKDALVSQLFDQAWGEVSSWKRCFFN